MSVALLAMAAGCAESLPPGQAGLRVTALAEPKAGYVQPPPGTPGYSAAPEGPEDDTTARRDPYRILDYNNLDDIVVYLVPQDASAAAAPTAPQIAIDLSDRQKPGVRVSGIGGELLIRNGGAKAAAVYLRSESGAIIDLANVPAGGSFSHSLAAPGAFTLMRESSGADDQAVAELYIAPNGWVARCISGGRAVFKPLPAGRYILGTWHPRLPGQQKAIDLTAGFVADEEAKVGVNRLPKTN